MADIFDLFKKISTENTQPAGGAPEWIIAGLGNPGDEYMYTRHNAGFMAMDYMAQKYSCQIKQIKFKSLVGNTKIGDKNVLLMKPQTYMNASGDAISEAAQFYKIKPENIIVIVDDICQAPGRMRIRRNGSDGGHNGLKSIILRLSSDAFPRVRIGVGEKPNKEYDLAAWVLGKFNEEDRKLLFGTLDATCGACELIMNGKTEEAMGKYNGFKATI